ncbi:MAG: IS630 transposase-related protein [Oscillospiraceae bacterium]|nr:IS630 transposase-related protein [Oscillospiraceae bacterium]
MKQTRGFKKIDSEKLKAHGKEHPNNTQQEMAEAFGCCNLATSKALKRYGIIQKKDSTILSRVTISVKRDYFEE